MFAFRKNRLLYEKLEAYFKVAKETMVVFREAMVHLLENGIDDHFSLLTERTCQAESDADDSRRNIEQEMFGESLLPETREDILLIIELLDKVPTQSKEIVKSFNAQRILPDPSIAKQVGELVELSVQAFESLVEATKISMGKSQKKIADLSRVIDNNESLGDRLEYAMVKTIFALDMTIGEKILQRDMVESLGSLLDLAENAVDRIVILCVKRHIQ